MKKISQILPLFFLIIIAGLLSCKEKTETVQPPSGNAQENDTLTVADCIKCMVFNENTQDAVEIVDVGRSGAIVWSWYPTESNIASKDMKWFTTIDDVKPVYNLKYLLINASGDGVALIRISDKKVVWYAHVGSNPHSSEILPDGNIVSASSTDNRLVIFHVDTTEAPNSGYRKVIDLPFAHNVVWDKKRQVLWTAGENTLYVFEYNFNCKKPDLTLKSKTLLPGTDAHDLFPVYGKDSLWLTHPDGTYVIDLNKVNDVSDLSGVEITRAATTYQTSVKSVSSGPEGWPTIIQSPTKSWWADRIVDFDGTVMYSHSGWQIYKARWFLPNLFSYPENDEIKTCN